MKAPRFEACTGEAHTNPHIDNCGMCAPFWGRIALCANCTNPARLHLSKSRRTGQCYQCKARFDVRTSD